VPCTPEELRAADLVVLLVDHPAFPYDDIRDHAPLVLDTRGRLRELGFRGESL
jgi:UDP-N-acetyl-D-glucosamine dehydrogenase